MTKRSAFNIALQESERDSASTDIVLSGSTKGIMPDRYRGKPIAFIQQCVCKPLLDSQLQFHKLNLYRDLSATTAPTLDATTEKETLKSDKLKEADSSGLTPA